MNGPEHYAEAERLLADIASSVTGKHAYYVADPEGSAALQVSAAQVHATLALAAATALDPSSFPDSTAHRAWSGVTR